MMTGHLGPVSIEVCQRCAGVWLSSADLARVIQGGTVAIWRLCEALRAARIGSGGEEAPSCPRCRLPLSEREFPAMKGLPLLTCYGCDGFWLDEPILCKLAMRLTDIAGKSPKPVDDPSATRPVKAPRGQAAGLGNQDGAKPAGAAPAEDSRQAAPEAPEKNLCPACGQPNTEGASVCWACGRMLKGAATGKCPRCEGTLHRLLSERVEIDACDGCGGVWMAHGRLGALLLQSWEEQDRLLADVAKTRTGRIRKKHPELFCPFCKLLMFPTPMAMFTKRPVDTCPKCSAAFLDEGALDEILVGRRI